MRFPAYLSLLNRRQWLKILLLGSVANTGLGKMKSLAGNGAAASGVAPGAQPAPQSISAQLSPGTGNYAVIPIRISDFPGLADPWGSVAVYFSNIQYPIVINRDDNNNFYAIDPTCTHQGCQVDNYDTGSFSMLCQCHGSEYSIDGRVVVGPAQYDLSVYPSRFDGNDLLEIELVGVPLRIDSVSVQSSTASNTRLRIDFPGVSGIKYQVKYFASLAAAPVPVLFAFAAGAPANQSSFTVPSYSPSDPLSGDGTKSIWVDAPGTTGFFAVEMVLGDSLPL